MALRADLDLLVACRAAGCARRCRSWDRWSSATPRRSSRATLRPLGGSPSSRRSPRRRGSSPGPWQASQADVDLRPLRRVSVRLRVVALAHVGRVAVRAHEVPVLLPPGPVQLVAGGRSARSDRGGTSAGRLLSGRASHAIVRRLQPAAGELDQVLLQRRDAERVLDLVVGELAVGPVGADEELAVAPGEGRRHAGVLEGAVGEVAEHGALARLLHRARVLRAAPRFGFLFVTARARLAADEFEFRLGGRRRGRGGLPRVPEEHEPDDRRDGDRRAEEPSAHGETTRYGRCRAELRQWGGSMFPVASRHSET